MKNLVLFIVLTFSTKTFSVEKINGAGATFPYPLYSKWFSEYKKIMPSVEFNYQSIGSGGGVKQVQAQTVDFGASDTPMSAEEISKSKVEIKHFPSTLGAITIAYNNPNIPNHLKIKAKSVADIFEGKITKWNDPEIASINPNITLPNEDILVIRRSDGSGTTANFTGFLTAVSESWKKNYGIGKSVRWKAGIGAKGNEGVTAMVSQIEGSIGYIEYAYAINNNLKVMAVENANNEFIIPNPETVSLAGLALDFKNKNFTGSILNSTIKGSYPISAYTYLLIPNESKKKSELNAFLTWALTDGQKYSKNLLYAPLPSELSEMLLKEIK